MRGSVSHSFLHVNNPSINKRQNKIQILGSGETDLAQKGKGPADDRRDGSERDVKGVKVSSARLPTPHKETLRPASVNKKEDPVKGGGGGRKGKGMKKESGGVLACPRGRRHRVLQTTNKNLKFTFSNKITQFTEKKLLWNFTVMGNFIFTKMIEINAHDLERVAQIHGTHVIQLEFPCCILFPWREIIFYPCATANMISMN